MNFTDYILDYWLLTLFRFVLGDGDGVNGTEVNTSKHISRSNNIYLFHVTEMIGKIEVSLDTIKYWELNALG